MDTLNRINFKTLRMLLIGITALLLTSSSVYGIWPQVKDMKSGLMTRNELRELVTSEEQLEIQKAGLVQGIESIRTRLRGDMANLPENKMEAYIIGELQNISWNHEINLIGVKPVEGNQIQMFQEILFNVQISGAYFDLYEWLKDLRSQLGFIVINNLELNLINERDKDALLLMKLTIASYKSVQE